MRRLLSIVFLIGFGLHLAAEEEVQEVPFDRFYAGASALLLLPGNGTTLNRRAGGELRAGWYLAEDFAVEAQALWAEGLYGAGAGGLWHFFGYERFDPFLTFGVRGHFGDGRRFGDGRHRTAFGPCAGLGAFWHLTETCSLRADAVASLGFDSPCSMVYALQLGVQWSFGGGE